ncbi:MAG: hypothetical protein ACO3RV_04325 [Luteolibacter sp.]
MSAEVIPQISLGAAALVIFATCVLWLFLRGMLRMLIGTSLLGGSMWLGWWVWQHSPSLFHRLLGRQIPWMENSLALVAAAVSFFLLRWLLGMIIHPTESGTSSKFTLSRLPLRLLVALLPTSVILLFVIVSVHHAGSLNELKALANSESSGKMNRISELLQNLKQSVDERIPASWLNRLDPMMHEDRVGLIRQIISSQDNSPSPAIDRNTGKMIPRAILIDEPELQTLAREGKIGSLVRHPMLKELSNRASNFDSSSPP